MSVNEEKVEKIMKNKINYRNSVKEAFDIQDDAVVDEIINTINDAPEEEQETMKKELSDAMRMKIYEDVVMNQLLAHSKDRGC
jgi:hypothetical protein